MYPETISLEVDSPGDFVLAELIRPGSNNILVAANANSRYASVQAGYLYVQLLIRGPSSQFSSTYAQLLAGPTWDLYNPSWTGYLPLSDDSFIVCRTCSVAHNTVRFNLSFIHLQKGDHYAGF